jgi:hypothetical protein
MAARMAYDHIGKLRSDLSRCMHDVAKFPSDLSSLRFGVVALLSKVRFNDILVRLHT